jgi:hypothetical protein
MAGRVDTGDFGDEQRLIAQAGFGGEQEPFGSVARRERACVYLVDDLGECLLKVLFVDAAEQLAERLASRWRWMHREVLLPIVVLGGL